MTTAVPTHVITGFLGTGKTTAILKTLEQTPSSERWAVLVNEFGEVGIDGARLGASGVAVREVPGGCMCCVGGLPFSVALRRMLQEVQPHRVLVEPSGLALTHVVVDTLRKPGMGVDLQSVVTLVDPRHIQDPRYTQLDTWHSQVVSADVLVAAKADQRSTEELAAFHTWAEGRWPGPAQVGVMGSEGLAAAWLEPVSRPPGFRVLSSAHPDEGFAKRSWTWPRTVSFSHTRLSQGLRQVVERSVDADLGLGRWKGIFRTDKGWRSVDIVDGRIDWHPTSYRADSRWEGMVQGASDASFAEVGRILSEALVG